MNGTGTSNKHPFIGARLPRKNQGFFAGDLGEHKM